MDASAQLTEYAPGMPWAIVQLKNQWFAIASAEIREILMVPEVAAVPGEPDYIRGVINLRGRVMPLVDLRKRLGLTSVIEEAQAFCDLMARREEDHRRWLAELEASVRELRKFQLTTDPHQCAFGKWYDAYKPDNPWVTALLGKFKEPHGKIHGVAIQVGELVAAGQHEQAALRIAETRATTLSEMIQLFAELKNLTNQQQRETVVVLAAGGRTLGVCVDSAVSVEKLAAGSVEPLPAGAAAVDGGVVCRVAKRAGHPEPLLLIEAGRILDRHIKLAA